MTKRVWGVLAARGWTPLNVLGSPLAVNSSGHTPRGGTPRPLRARACVKLDDLQIQPDLVPRSTAGSRDHHRFPRRLGRRLPSPLWPPAPNFPQRPSSRLSVGYAAYNLPRRHGYESVRRQVPECLGEVFDPVVADEVDLCLPPGGKRAVTPFVEPRCQLAKPIESNANASKTMFPRAWFPPSMRERPHRRTRLFPSARNQGSSTVFEERYCHRGRTP